MKHRVGAPVPATMPESSIDAIDLSVVIPAYNEADRIVETIQITVAELDQLDCTYEVVVVDDGSQDETFRLAGQLAAEGIAAPFGRVRVITYAQNGGKGHAVKYGAARTLGRWVAFLDADLELHPRLLGQFLTIQASTNADLVIGSKRHPESIINYPTERKLYSTVYFHLCRLLFDLPVRDTQTGIKLMSGEFARRVLPLLTVNRFAYDLEMLVVAHRLGLRIVEAPVQLTFKRPFGRIGMRDIWRICRDTMAIWWRLKLSSQALAQQSAKADRGSPVRPAVTTVEDS